MGLGDAELLQLGDVAERDDRFEIAVGLGHPEADIRAAGELTEAVRPLCDRVAARLQEKGIAGATLVLKLKTADFQILTRNRRLPSPTQRADVLYRNARLLIEKEADGRAFRLIGIGVADLCPATEADQPDLFDGLTGAG